MSVIFLFPELDTTRTIIDGNNFLLESNKNGLGAGSCDGESMSAILTSTSSSTLTIWQ